MYCTCVYHTYLYMYCTCVLYSVANLQYFNNAIMPITVRLQITSTAHYTEETVGTTSFSQDDTKTLTLLLKQER